MQRAPLSRVAGPRLRHPSSDRLEQFAGAVLENDLEYIGSELRDVDEHLAVCNLCLDEVVAFKGLYDGELDFGRALQRLPIPSRLKDARHRIISVGTSVRAEVIRLRKVALDLAERQAGNVQIPVPFQVPQLAALAAGGGFRMAIPGLPDGIVLEVRWPRRAGAGAQLFLDFVEWNALGLADYEGIDLCIEPATSPPPGAKLAAWISDGGLVTRILPGQPVFIPLTEASAEFSPEVRRLLLEWLDGLKIWFVPFPAEP